ncbi:phospholipase D-like domain-containing protein [Micromonospora sp. WMMD754]|uniref:phospholipase D-like domain-containing protein n=1 Tax=Micromonospora sp. WMMD754 TaxID=3404114 RepID=UPI003BF5BA50
MQTICEKAEGRKIKAAVAYAGDGAADLLPAKAGDLIVVNGSRNALASGATSARLLRQWYEQDVVLYAHETLHAKVFVVGRTAFVGSANLSRRAHNDGTIEAAIQTSDPLVCADARRFVDEMAAGATRVDETWLDWAASVPVSAGGTVLWNPDPPFLPDMPYDIWIGPEVAVDYTDEEEALAAEGRRIHRASGGRYQTITLREDIDEQARLEQPDMVVIIRSNHIRLARFLGRRRRRQAAMGFYRTDSQGVRRTLREVAGVLDMTPASLREDWIRLDPSQRELLVDLFELPKLPVRSS